MSLLEFYLALVTLLCVMWQLTKTVSKAGNFCIEFNEQSKKCPVFSNVYCVKGEIEKKCSYC